MPRDTRPIPATRSRPGSVSPMTDQPDDHAWLESQDAGPDAEPEEASPGEPFANDVPEEDRPTRSPESTGHPAVDEVLRSLEGLDGRPVDEHVAAFEHAHEVLRGALSHAGDDPVTRPED